MVDSSYYGEFLKTNIPTARYASGGKEILCRCFYCPDSADMSSAHFYIQIPQNKNEVSKFYCHKCHTSGYVTHKVLIQWGIYDDSIASFLIDHNKHAISNRKNNKLYIDNVNYFYNPGLGEYVQGYSLYNDFINVILVNYINNLTLAPMV